MNTPKPNPAGQYAHELNMKETKSNDPALGAPVEIEC
jgi:hypothetical protein